MDKLPPKYVPRSMIDTGEGLYDGTKRCVWDYEQKTILRYIGMFLIVYLKIGHAESQHIEQKFRKNALDVRLP